MRNDPVLRAQGLGKVYRRFPSELRRIASWFFAIPPLAENWVIRDVSLEIAPGEAVAIIGENGAGKSTLLKMFAGILQPSSGSVEVAGSVSAILELGMGFNAELTGRQNARHAAGLMGFSRERIDALMPGIEAFAEIGDYFDEPMRKYSSGMQMRVAFAVATGARPDLLIIDEALSVGDAYFQHKSFARIREFRRQGTTLLIVSHDKEAVQSLCDRALLLDHGEIVRDSDPESTLDLYNALIARKENTSIETSPLSSGGIQTRSGTGEARVEHAGLYDAEGHCLDTASVGQHVALHIRVRVHAPVAPLVAGYLIKDRLGNSVFGTNTWHTDHVVLEANPGDVIDYRARFTMNLGPGSYAVSVALQGGETHLDANYDWLDYAVLLTITNPGKPHFIGTNWMAPRIEYEHHTERHRA